MKCSECKITTKLLGEMTFEKASNQKWFIANIDEQKTNHIDSGAFGSWYMIIGDVVNG